MKICITNLICEYSEIVSLSFYYIVRYVHITADTYLCKYLHMSQIYCYKCHFMFAQINSNKYNTHKFNSVFYKNTSKILRERRSPTWWCHNFCKIFGQPLGWWGRLFPLNLVKNPIFHEGGDEIVRATPFNGVFQAVQDFFKHF